MQIVFIVELKFSLFRRDDNEGERAHEQKHGVEHQGNDVEGAVVCFELGCGNGGEGHEHLGSVRENPLHNATEGVEQRSRFAWRNFEFVAHLFGDWGCHHNGDCIVCRSDIHGAYQKANAQLASSVALENLVDKVKQGDEPAVDADEPAHGAHENRDHDGFVHARNSRTDIPDEADKIYGARKEHDDGRKCDAHEKYDEYVNPDEGKGEYDHVRDELR